MYIWFKLVMRNLRGAASSSYSTKIGPPARLFVMNNYRLLGLSSLIAAALLGVLMLLTGEAAEQRSLILTFEVSFKFPMTYLLSFVLVYFSALSVIVFRVAERLTLSTKFFCLYVLLLIIPLTVFALFVTLPDWTGSLFSFSGGGVPGGYYNDINNYGRINTILIALNVSGICIFGTHTIRQLQKTDQEKKTLTSNNE